MPHHRKSDAERLTTLLHLLKLGAVRTYADVSTRDLGSSLGLKQQSASLRLIELEKAGLVERARSGRRVLVRLTARGISLAEAFLADVNGSLKEGRDEVAFRGVVFAGLGEGGYYVSLGGYAGSFRSALGFEPFPGTLNLSLTTQAMIDQRRALDLTRGIVVPGFSDDRRSFGPVKCFRAKIEGRHIGAVLVIERTHYDTSVLEVISPVNLRRSLGLNDGDECSVIVFLREGGVRGRSMKGLSPFRDVSSSR